MSHFSFLHVDGWPTMAIIGPSRTTLMIIDGTNKFKLDWYVQQTVNYFTGQLNPTPIEKSLLKDIQEKPG